MSLAEMAAAGVRAAGEPVRLQRSQGGTLDTMGVLSETEELEELGDGADRIVKTITLAIASVDAAGLAPKDAVTIGDRTLSVYAMTNNGGVTQLTLREGR